jgi:hypothetical protein
VPKFKPGFLTRTEVGRREFIGGAENPRFKLHGVEIRDIQIHARGRAEATAEVAAGVTFLKSQGLIPETAEVTYSGAAYQDASATGEHQRAHRFPCNPKINIWNIPELPPRRADRLRELLKRPLAATDFVPRTINYADGVFERSGACETVVEMVVFIIQEQKKGKPVDLNLVRHAVLHIALPGYLNACELGRQKILQDLQHDTPGLDFTRPDWVELANQSALSTRPKSTRPTENLAGAADVLFISANDAVRYEPQGVIPKAITDFVALLLAAMPHD